MDRLLTPGIDVTCGSLGQGASVAAGIAWALKHEGAEGQYVYVHWRWRAERRPELGGISVLAHNRLNNCIVFIDNNNQHDGWCTEVLNPFSYEEKMKAFWLLFKTVGRRQRGGH